MIKNKNNTFWTSYTDLMTSLFFIMLALYVFSYVSLRIKHIATEKELKKIKELQTAVKNLPKEYFSYDSTYKRYILIKQIQFDKQKSDFNPIYNDYLIKVGKSIEQLITTLKSKYKNENVKYMIIIEGMASDDNYTLNNQLSYARALALYNFWKAKNINFDPNVCEVQIAGSGTGGVGRDKNEIKNQRFLIQIIPKSGDIKI